LCLVALNSRLARCPSNLDIKWLFNDLGSSGVVLL
jgi:hypothetical protein